MHDQLIKTVPMYGSDSVTSVTLSTNASLSSSVNYNAGTWAITPSAATGSGLANYQIPVTAATHGHAENQFRGSDRHGR